MTREEIEKGAKGAAGKPPRQTYLKIITKLTTRVYRASDSISTNPSRRAKRITAEAPGFRAMASAAPATALPCARPHRPDAIAIEIAEATGTQWALGFAAAPVAGAWANIIVLASRKSASSIIIRFVIVLS